MDEENQGNLDSFVDIVANTAGIMIVLVIMSLMGSDKAGSKHNVNKVKLSQLKEDEGNLLTRIEDFNEVELRKRHNTNLKRRRSGLSRLKLGTADLKRLPAVLEKAQAQKAQERVALEKIRGDEKEAVGRLDAAKVEVGKLVTKEQMELLKDKDAGALESALVNIRALTEDFKKETVTFRGRKKELDGEAASTEKEIAVLDAFELKKQGETLVVAGPAAGPEHDRQRIWFECFMPETPKSGDDALRARVRLVSQATYVEEGEKDKRSLRPQHPGETTFDIMEESSDFQQFLINQPKVTTVDEAEKKLYLMFVVRPDAYRVFRLARKIAREEGWQVDWRPIEAAVPRKTTGAASPAARLVRNPG